MGQLGADLDDSDSGSGTTIVGGQPPGGPRRSLQNVPVGMERLLWAAATDAAFREALLRDRDAAAAARGFALRRSEVTMLRLAPREQLAAAIDGLDTSSASLERRTFMRAVAASVITLAAADALSGCGDEGGKLDVRPPGVDAGVRWEGPMAGVRLEDGRPPGADAGVRVDWPRPGPDAGVRVDRGTDHRVADGMVGDGLPAKDSTDK
jgi:hypothetical protein